jgi:Flp pilus assembly pilin Flp
MVPCRNLPDEPGFTGKLRDFWRDERAATSIEYAIIAAGISTFIAGAVYSLGDAVNQEYYVKILAAVRSANAANPANP